jgi:hypothetical protein
MRTENGPTGDESVGPFSCFGEKREKFRNCTRNTCTSFNEKEEGSEGPVSFGLENKIAEKALTNLKIT